MRIYICTPMIYQLCASDRDQFTGFIIIPANATYTFELSSDDGSLLFIDNSLVANNDGLHGLAQVRTPAHSPIASTAKYTFVDDRVHVQHRARLASMHAQQLQLDSLQLYTYICMHMHVYNVRMYTHAYACAHAYACR